MKKKLLSTLLVLALVLALLPTGAAAYGGIINDQPKPWEIYEYDETYFNSWNDYFMQLIMLSSTSNLTISLGIAKLQAENSTDFGLIMAGAALAAVPIIIIFLIFQKYFTKGIAMDAVKG